MYKIKKSRFKNIQCQEFHGMCRALGPVYKNKYNYTTWLFECFHNGPGCVGEFEAIPGRVKSGERKSCGCHKRENITGKIFYDSDGVPTCQALWYLGSDKYYQAEWLFRCFINGPGCKETFPALAKSVKCGDTQSCGCYNKKVHTIHGMCRSPEYTSWKGMHQRCYNPNHHAYHNYGRRGIKVCWRWHKDNPDGFKNFLADMGTKPDGYTLERLNNNGDYSPDNCKWRPRAAQNRNQNRNKIKDLHMANTLRWLYDERHYTFEELKDMVNCSNGNIRHIISNRTWNKLVEDIV